MKAQIAIIGGTGIYDPEMLKDKKTLDMDTPYGKPSDTIITGTINGKRVAFLNRHGPGHRIPPHLVNSRANIYALKQLGITRILAPTAVGSLKEEYRPGDIAIIDQFIDRTTGRAQTFYDQGQVCHISVADPFCESLRKILIDGCKTLGYSHHDKGTMVCINGPRFSTRAESRMFQSWDADTINMTLVPECILARELEICYVSIATITDYDCWKESNVTLDEVVSTMKENEHKVKNLLINAIENIPEERDCACMNALDGALIGAKIPVSISKTEFNRS